MGLALTTVDRVKGVYPLSTTDKDAQISDLIAAVSQEAEQYMGRHAQAMARTEVYELRPNRLFLWLRGFPIASVTAVRISDRRRFTGVDPVDPELYDVHPERGQIEFQEGAIPDITQTNWVQVDYSGGMAATDAAFVTAFPRISGAVTTEVVNRLNRSKNPEGNLTSLGGDVAYQKPLEPLEDFYKALDHNRRVVL